MPNNQSNLAKDIQKLIDQGLNQVADEATSQQITTYWQIGQRINQELENSQNPYHNSIIKDLSKEIDFDNSKLSRCLNFFKSYPQVPNDNSLNWSHYRVLITIKDNDLRQQFQSQIIQENWSKQNQSNPTQKNLNRPTDPLYLYKAKVIEIIDGDTILINLDLGCKKLKKIS